MADLVWSEGIEKLGWNSSKAGAGYEFGEDITDCFLKQNNLVTLVVSKFVADGYQWLHNGKLVQVFSAPNYLGKNFNKAAILCVDDLTNCIPIVYPDQKKKIIVYKNVKPIIKGRLNNQC